MRVKDFELKIKSKFEDRKGYVKMYHGEVYEIELRSRVGRRSDVTVSIDGKDVGTWRLEPWATITVARGVKDRGKFTFFQKGSQEGYASGFSSVSTNGLSFQKFLV